MNEQSDRYIYFNNNPIRGNRVGDCTVRAISKATGQEWNHTYCALAAYGLSCKDMPSANNVWGKYLRDLGFRRYLIESEKHDYTVENFCEDHPEGTYILAIEGHVVCVVDGYYYDSWRSGSEIPIYFWSRESRRANGT